MYRPRFIQLVYAGIALISLTLVGILRTGDGASAARPALAGPYVSHTPAFERQANALQAPTSPAGSGVGTWDAGFGAPGVMGGYVWAVAVAPTGDVYIGGSFTGAGGVSANNIARWDGTHWHP